MSLYMCEKCGCVENTALGFYWSRDQPMWPEDVRGKALCSECGPTTFSNGDPTDLGVWHGRFEKRSAKGYHLDSEGFLWSAASVAMNQVPKHLKIVKIIE